MPESIYQLLEQCAARREAVALGIISEVKGSSPQKLGAKALFYADGRIQGTLGGGCLEAEIQDRARRALLTGEPATFQLVLDHDFGWDDGLICGGKVSGIILPNVQTAGEVWAKLAPREQVCQWEVTEDFTIQLTTDSLSKVRYRETVRPPSALWIAGAGHIAQAVTPLAQQIDFTVTVMDDRPALANLGYFPPGTNFVTGDWPEIFATPFPSRPTYGLIVTRGHRHDALVLERWIHLPFAFLGMIGSSRKARTIVEHFTQQGIATPEALARVACPVGIKIGAVSVPEIAVSILAQYIEKRRAAESGLPEN